MVVIHQLSAGIAHGYEPQVRAFSIVPLSIVLSFAALVAAFAMAKRADAPSVHMRLMLACVYYDSAAGHRAHRVPVGGA